LDRSFDACALVGLLPDEAVERRLRLRYRRLCDGQNIAVRSHPNIALFLQELSQRYPPIQEYDARNLDACPWSYEWSLSPNSVLVCVTWSRSHSLTPALIEMASRYDLLCYDPQQQEATLPPSLAAM
jgi:hypothetical protein